MANIFNALHWQFKSTAINNLIVKNEVRQANLVRSILVSGLAVLIGVIILLYFNKNVQVNTVIEIRWKANVMFVHLYTTIAFLFLFVTGIYIKRYSVKNSYALVIFSSAVFFVLIQWGLLCTIYDQAISTSIIAFLMASVVATMIVLIRPIYLFVYLSLIYLIFYIGIAETQSDANTVVFNSINGLCTVFIAFALGFISWKSNMSRSVQSRLLAQSTRELKKANTSKDTFFSILAHDLKGPINSTLALTELLESGYFETNEVERQEVYKLLQSSLYNSAKLLDNVLLWARSQSGNITFNPLRLNLHETIQSSIDVLKIVAANKNISIDNLAAKDTFIFADPDMINTIFRNLLSNAIKFTPNSGQVKVLSEELKSGKAQKDLINISIADCGIGMNRETLKSLFHIENKVSGLGTNKETGTGLGLVLCKDFIEKHGGTIHVESAENKGSTFTISLPA